MNTARRNAIGFMSRDLRAFAVIAIAVTIILFAGWASAADAALECKPAVVCFDHELRQAGRVGETVRVCETRIVCEVRDGE